MYVCTYVCEIYVHKGTWKLHKMQHTKNIRSAISVRVAGKTQSKMWKFLIRSIALLTWILNDAILLFSTNSLCVNCSAPLRKGRIFKLTPRGIKYLAMSNPLSAITESPDSN